MKYTVFDSYDLDMKRTIEAVSVKDAASNFVELEDSDSAYEYTNCGRTPVDVVVLDAVGVISNVRVWPEHTITYFAVEKTDE
jgi:hypothetical protein